MVLLHKVQAVNSHKIKVLIDFEHSGSYYDEKEAVSKLNVLWKDFRTKEVPVFWILEVCLLKKHLYMIRYKGNQIDIVSFLKNRIGLTKKDEKMFKIS